MPPSVASSTASLTRPSGGSGRAANEPGARLPGGKWRAGCVGGGVFGGGGGRASQCAPPARVRAHGCLRCAPRAPSARRRPPAPPARCAHSAPARAFSTVAWARRCRRMRFGMRKDIVEPMQSPCCSRDCGGRAVSMRGASDQRTRRPAAGTAADGWTGERAHGERAHVIPYQKSAPAVARATATKKKAKNQPHAVFQCSHPTQY